MVTDLEQSASSQKSSDVLLIRGLKKNKHGHRTPRENYSERRTNKQLRIAFIGESTTLGQFVESWEAFPYQVELQLSKVFPDLDVLSMNMGRGGAIIRENLNDYIIKHQYFDADLVVIHVGINDAASRIAFGTEQYNPPVIEIAETPRKYETFLLNNGFTGPFMRYAYVWWLEQSNQDLIKIQEKLNEAAEQGRESTIEAAGGESKALQRAKDNTEFYNYTKSLVQLIKLNGSKVILYTIPGNPYLNVEHKDILRVGLESNTFALRKISEEENVYFVEIDPYLIPHEAWYADYDQCHLRPEGHIIKTKILSDNICSILQENTN